ncbi:MAG: zf-HC2 domain-containing protein [Gemmatimonadota bacterium]|jgi:hypothetical protein
MSARQGHLGDTRIHDLIDGDLDGVEERAARTHLARCEACARRVATVEALLNAVHALPAEAMPSRDLWPGIEERIRGGASVIPFPGPGGREDAVAEGPATAGGSTGGRPASDGPVPVGRRRVTVSLPLLWAAGIAVSLVSGGAVWVALGGESPRVAAGPDGRSPATGVSRVGAPDRVPTTRIRSASTAYAEATAELEAILESGRALLDEETLRTVEESLATIDRAIAEAEEALARDPGSELLHRLLLQHERTRLRILRQATNGLSAAT